MIAGGLAVAGPSGVAHATPTKPSTPTAGLPAGSTAATAAGRASARAHSTGKTVPIPEATTSTSTLAANPNGSFTLTQNIQPVRKHMRGGWKKLDAKLVRNPDGSYSPAVSTNSLTVSGGGTGPLAVMGTGAKKLALTAPMRLPKPVAAADTLTYRDVLPGVDLWIRADSQGGFREVFIVHNAKAAADPRLKDLAFATKTSGLNLGVDPAGNITASDRHGNTYYSASSPTMWDSAAPTDHRPTAVNPSTGATVDATSGDPITSSPTGAGIGAHTTTLKTTKQGDKLHLTPDPGLLTGPNVVYPVYVDPTFPAAGGKVLAYTYIDSARPTTSYYNNVDSDGLRVGFQDFESPHNTARSFAQLAVDPRLYGAAIDRSTLTITEIWSASCTAEPVELWHTSGIYPSTTWSNPPNSWYERLDTQTVAHGRSGCAAAGVGFNTTALMTTAAANSWTLANFGLRASSETNDLQWKRFDPKTISITTTYNHAPDAPDPLTTSPATDCSGGSTVGNGDVFLNSYVSDPDDGDLNVTMKAWVTSTGTVLGNTTGLSAAAGTTATLRLPKATLTGAAGGAQLGISWNVHVADDFGLTSDSATCSFSFDPTVPGAPTITPGSTSYTVGTPTTFTISPNSSGATPNSYQYQLNYAPPVTVGASASPVTITISPTSRVDTLIVSALSVGGNIGDAATYNFTAAAPATASENDLTGDGLPDSLTVGGTTALPTGLWLGRGTKTSSTMAASNLGINGTGIDTANKPATWNGYQVITGHFATGSGFNDVLAYNPATGTGVLLFGTGDGSPLNPVSGSVHAVAQSTFTPDNTSPGGTTFATSIANGGSLSASGSGYPDLLVVVAGSLYLEPAFAQPGVYAGISSSLDLSDTNPTGTGSWASWTITTSLINGLPVMYARDTVSGALWYYPTSALQNLVNGQAASPIQVPLGGWTAASKPVLQAADINGDGTVDLWATNPTGTLQAYLATVNGTGVTFSPQTAQALNTATHAWALNDAVSGQASTATDAVGTLSLAGNAGASWHTGDIYSPDVQLNGTSGTLTSSAAVATNGDFTVSAWAKPDALGGIVLSQDGVHSAGFSLYPDADSHHWYFCLAQADTDATDYDCAITKIDVQLKVWTHLIATFKAATGTMALYVNGIDAATAHHGSDNYWNATGHFQVGDYLHQSQHTGYYAGQLSGVQAWNQTLTPLQAATLSTSPYQVFLPDNSNYPSGSSWTMPGGKMSFNAGLLTFTDAAGNTMATFGASGNPSAVLTLESNGNLAIYPTATHTPGGALWSTNTAGHTGDIAIYQADGNLDVLDSDGTMLRRDIVYQAAVINSATDLCLDSNGTGQVYTGVCNGGDFQQWRFNATGTIIDVATGYCLDNNSAAQVYTGTCNGGNFQSWTTPVNTGTIVNFATGGCLDSNSVGQVYTGTCNGGSYQTWIIDPPA